LYSFRIESNTEVTIRFEISNIRKSLQKTGRDGVEVTWCGTCYSHCLSGNWLQSPNSTKVSWSSWYLQKLISCLWTC